MTHVPAIPENAPFNAAQRVWLNGFLAGLFARNESENAPPAPAPVTQRLLILYGSQTGTAEGLARQIASEAARRGFGPRVMEANAGPKLDWAAEQRLLLVTSTYGDGDMPDSAQGFWDWLQTDEAKKLAHLSYSVLALGDTHYEQFCAAGKKIDARLEQLGASRVHPRTDCDTDYSAAARTWIEAALSAFGVAADQSAPMLETPPPQLAESQPPGLLTGQSVSRAAQEQPGTYRRRLQQRGAACGDSLWKVLAWLTKPAMPWAFGRATALHSSKNG